MALTPDTSRPVYNALRPPRVVCESQSSQPASEGKLILVHASGIFIVVDDIASTSLCHKSVCEHQHVLTILGRYDVPVAVLLAEEICSWL